MAVYRHMWQARLRACHDCCSVEIISFYVIFQAKLIAIEKDELNGRAFCGKCKQEVCVDPESALWINTNFRQVSSKYLPCPIIFNCYS